MSRKHTLERNIIYLSIVVQALLTFSVVCFCAYQLNRCPVNDRDTSDSSGVYDTPQCPRALYTNMITAAVASWFPSPWFSVVQVANSSTPDEREGDRQPEPLPKTSAKRKTRPKEEDEGSPK